MPAFGAGHDYPALGHIQGYSLCDFDERTFDSFSLDVEPGQKIPVEGHTISVKYCADDGSNHGSILQIYLNYLAVLKSLKAEILHSPVNMNDDKDHLLGRFYRNGAPVYVVIYAFNGGGNYTLFIVEEKDFQPSIVTSPER
jgi:hypothetical protein